MRTAGAGRLAAGSATPHLETNMTEAIRAYLGTVEPEEPLTDFVGTWRLEVSV